MKEPVLAATSSGSAVASLALANEVLQFVALVIAIVSGALAIYAHFKKRK